ncbi:riboflavin kinase [Kribbella sp. NPDC004536]|uniref:riboflavin kinase n=1 Tax=Kribbella sp. NPDC004536 TaxID=3364106 RepID=UPI0036CC33A3
MPLQPPAASAVPLTEVSLRGDVVRGDGRGRELGFPTANIRAVSPSEVPADGVYAGWLQVSSDWFPAAISVGANVTFDQDDRRIEAHVLDRTDLTLTGRHVTVRFDRRLRDMRKFRRVANLIEQMQRDIDIARRLLAEHEPVRENFDDQI